MKRPQTSWFSRFHQMSENLTLEQTEVFQFAKSGHNLLVTGQAGTGKSRVVNAVSDDCQQLDLRVSVICSSGIACLVYDPGVASTVLSLYGLGAADLPAELLMSSFDSGDLCFNIRWVENEDLRPNTQKRRPPQNHSV